MEITIKITKNYGQIAIYPQSPKAVLFTEMLGTKTLPQYALRIIQQLGYKIVVDYSGTLIPFNWSMTSEDKQKCSH